MSLDVLRSLLLDFGAGIGLPDLAPDDQGYCCLQFGEHGKLSLQYEPEGRDLVLFARLAEVGPGNADRQFLLEQDQGGALAIDPGEGVAFLLMKEKLQVLDLPGFEALLEWFVAAAEAWQSRLQALTGRVGAESPAPAAAECQGGPRAAGLSGQLVGGRGAWARPGTSAERR